MKGYKIGGITKDFWSNVQAGVNELFFSAGMKLEVDYKHFNPEYGTLNTGKEEVKLKVLPQYVLAYPIQEEKYYPETCIIHYKNYKNRNRPADVYRDWVDR